VKSPQLVKLGRFRRCLGATFAPKTPAAEVQSSESGRSGTIRGNRHANLSLDGAVRAPGSWGWGWRWNFDHDRSCKRDCALARALGAVVLVLAESLLLAPTAIAQSLWNGTTPTYETNSNWIPPTTPPSPPVAAGQQAVFDAGGLATVIVTSPAIAPDSWTFNPTAQSYTISGGAVNFSLAGPTGGIIDNTVGQTITISNNIGESTPGVQVQINASGFLDLSGNNSYTAARSPAISESWWPKITIRSAPGRSRLRMAACSLGRPA